MNEQLEYLRLVIDATDSRSAKEELFKIHYPRLCTLADGIRDIHPSETRRGLLLQRFNKAQLKAVSDKNLMPVVDVLCEIYQKTNNDNVRRLIDGYEGGWS